jgi:hypothetical protein
MDNLQAIKNCATAIIENLAPKIEAIRKIQWGAQDGQLKLVLLTVIVSQHECISVAISPEAKELLQFLVPSVRTACEELIWAKYLVSLDRKDAEILIRFLSADNIFKSLCAQQAYDPNSIESLGLTAHFETWSRIHASSTHDFAELAKRLKWSVRSGIKAPSVRYIAEKVELGRLYALIYSASSRFVHFSPQELLRRVWGESGVMTISSSNFSQYWACFGVYWSLELFLDLLISLNGFLNIVPPDILLAAVAKYGEIDKIPIVTAEELD